MAGRRSQGNNRSSMSSGRCFLSPPLVSDVRSADQNTWVMIKEAIKDLSKLADEGLALLRSEVQVICFYHLHQFSHLKLGTCTRVFPRVLC